MKLVLSADKTNDIITDENCNFKWAYVADKNTRLGFLLIWEIKSLRAINISRVKVPHDFPFIDIEDEATFAKVIPKELMIEGM